MRKARGFTLVELVFVIAILGIIMAVAVPRVIRSTTSASENTLKQDLQAVRSAIDLYMASHDGVLPGATPDGLGAGAGSELSFKNQLMYYTNAAGAVSKSKSLAHPLGPYLRPPFPSAPVGPHTGETTVKVETAGVLLNGADESTGWRYDTKIGDFILNSNNFSSDGVTPYDRF